MITSRLGLREPRCKHPGYATAMNDIFSWADTSSWASLVETLSHRRLSRKRVREALQSRYAGLEVLHACRPASLCPYYENGLLLSNSELLDKEAVVRFFGSSATFAELAAVDAAVKKLGERDHGRLFVSIDRRSLIERSGHYLIYGSGSWPLRSWDSTFC